MGKLMRMSEKILMALGLACFGFAPSSVPAGGAQKAAAVAQTSRPVTLPISLLDVMRASIEIPADGIWAAEGADKMSQEDWQLADQDAVNLIAATTLLATAGTGKNDAKWVANVDWQRGLPYQVSANDTLGWVHPISLLSEARAGEVGASPGRGSERMRA
jgi:hypothetical protein